MRSSFYNYKGEHRQESFILSTQRLIKFCTTEKSSSYNLVKLCSKLGFHQRRFYDVINVLHTIGYCTKLDNVSIKWNGLQNVKHTIKMMMFSHKLSDNHTRIELLVPGDGSITISQITESFLMCFIALGQQYLDIKDISYFLSLNSGRMKTTLCKLYQIAQILEVAGIISKTQTVSQLKLNDPYFVNVAHYFPKEDDSTPLSLNMLLNRPVKFVIKNPIVLRQEKYHNIVKQRLISSSSNSSNSREEEDRAESY